MRYEPTHLYCLNCEQQPEYFYEAVAPHLVTADGTHIEMYDAENLRYQCCQCSAPAVWGCGVREDRRKPQQHVPHERRR